MVVRIHPREPVAMTPIRTYVGTVFVAALLAASCKKGEETASSTPDKALAQERLGCDHDLTASAVARHTWPYPAELRDLRWSGGYGKVALKLKPTRASFVTATVSWREGDLIEVHDSEVRITKPRRLVAKRDILVRRKVWDQGIEVERSFLAAKQGELGSFLFYNSRGLCMVGTEDGPGWTPCSLEDTFEGLSTEDPHPCAQQWWVKVQKSRVDKGWMVVDESVMERVPSPDASR